MNYNNNLPYAPTSVPFDIIGPIGGGSMGPPPPPPPPLSQPHLSHHMPGPLDPGPYYPGGPSLGIPASQPTFDPFSAAILPGIGAQNMMNQQQQQQQQQQYPIMYNSTSSYNSYSPHYSPQPQQQRLSPQPQQQQPLSPGGGSSSNNYQYGGGGGGGSRSSSSSSSGVGSSYSRSMPGQQQQPQQQQQRQEQDEGYVNVPNSQSKSFFPASIAPTAAAQAKAQDAQNTDIDKIPELRGVDPALLTQILSQVVENTADNVKWEDIAGLKDAKQVLYETIILPALRPDIFQGLRAPAKGVLLFGPPGNGKTLLAKAVSSQCKATFFSISASSIESKWQGEGEKLVKALFSAANYLSPSVIFIDEIDSILTTRSTGEHEASRRMKTEFLVQIDGVTANQTSNKRVLVMGATNRPFDLDSAILRRFIKRIYIPLPDVEARLALIQNALKSNITNMTMQDLQQIAISTQGFSGSDLKALCQEAAMVAIREINNQQLLSVRPEQLRPITLRDFQTSLNKIRPTASTESIKELEKWNSSYGTGAAPA